MTNSNGNSIEQQIAEIHARIDATGWIEITQSHVSQLAVTMVQFAQNAEVDRATIREMQADIRGIQTENQQILRLLFGEGNNN